MALAAEAIQSTEAQLQKAENYLNQTLDEARKYLQDEAIVIQTSKGGGPTNPTEEYSNNVYSSELQYPYNNQYNNQYNNPYTIQYNNLPRMSYNLSQNKARDSKSKLSYYITVELELFPGKSINPFQKSVVKCQSTFERIRESYAEIFGYQYRPAPMKEVYGYNNNNNNNSKKNRNRNNNNNNSKKNRNRNNNRNNDNN